MTTTLEAVPVRDANSSAAAGPSWTHVAGLAALCVAANSTWTWAFSGSVAFTLLWATLLPIAIGALAARRGVPAAFVPPVSVVLFVPLAAWSCFGSPAAVGSVARSLPTMLRRIFDLALPLDRSGEPLLVALLSWWLVAALCVELAIRARRRLAVLAVALAGAVGGVLTSAPLGSPTLSGLLFGAAAAAFLVASAWSRASTPGSPLDPRRWMPSGWTRTAASVAVVAVAAGIAGGIGTPGSRPELHRSVPFNPSELLSPMAVLTRDLATNPPEPRFELTHLRGEPVDQIVLGSVADFDGVDWRITERFRAVGETAPADPRGDAVRHSAVRLRITGYDGGWVPHVGHVQEIRLTGPAEEEQLFADDDRSNIATKANLDEGTVVVAAGTELRDRDAPLPADPDETTESPDAYLQLPSQIEPIATADDTEPDGGCRLESILDMGREWAAGAGGGLAGVENQRSVLTAIESQIRSRFGVDPAFADGVSVASLCRALGIAPGGKPVPDGTRAAARSEQYATAMALMGRALGIPTRVVVGYQVPDSRGGAVQITSADVGAWVEAYLGPKGWVSFDPTPVSSGTATQQQRTVDPRQPTPPPDVSTSIPEAAASTTTTQPPATDTPDSLAETAEDIWSAPLVAGMSSLGVLALIGLVAGLIVMLKVRRRRKRRSAVNANTRIIGAWREAVDRIRDERIDLRPSWTNREVAANVQTATGNEAVGAVLVELGDISARARYSTVLVEEAEVEDAWELLDRLEAEFDTERSPIARLRSRVRLRSLFLR